MDSQVVQVKQLLSYTFTFCITVTGPSHQRIPASKGGQRPGLAHPQYARPQPKAKVIVRDSVNNITLSLPYTSDYLNW